jgi:hypothetical protein
MTTLDHPEESDHPAQAAGTALVVRAYTAMIDDVKPGERSVVAKINTQAVDRYRTVIDPMGVKLDAYRKNPVVLWEHGLDPVRGRVPIGRNIWIKARKQEGDIIAKTQYRDDDFSRMIFEMYREGTLRSFSIGAQDDASRSSPPTAAEIRARPELAECSMLFRSVDLCEYSSVAVGGNPEALALAVSRGLWVPDEIRVACRPLRAATENAPHAPADEAELPELPDRPALPPLTARRLCEVVEQRRAAIRACARREIEDIEARLDLRRGVV